MDLHSRGLLPPHLLLGTLCAEGALHLTLPGARVVSEPWTWAGVALLALGFMMLIWGAREFESAATPIRPGAPPRVLVTTGPFRISRNPMYLGFVAIALGAATLLGSLAAFVVVGILGRWLAMRFIRFEEDDLALQFGDYFRVYRREVPRWL